MNLLVVGEDRVDAGKTTFSTGLCAHLDAVGAKPRAGNDYWFDHDDYRTAVDDGRLFGKDAKRLAAASAADVSPERINPVHRLWRPSDGNDAGLVGPSHREFLCDRVGESYVVNAEADLPDTLHERLPLDDAHRVERLRELNALTRERYLPAFDDLADWLGRWDRVVVESYSDVARPMRDVSPDAVAAVGPGRVRVYRGDRFVKACEVAGGSARDGRLEERVGDVDGYLDPTATLALPALTDAERTDPGTVADAYEVAYDALVATALED